MSATRVCCADRLDGGRHALLSSAVQLWILAVALMGSTEAAMLFLSTAVEHWILSVALMGSTETAMSAVQHSRCTVRSSLSGSRTENKPPKLAPELERDIDMRLAISESEETRGAACVVRPLKLAPELERDIDMRSKICESEEARGAACVVRPLKLAPELERNIDMRSKTEEARGAACVVRPLSWHLSWSGTSTCG